MARRWEFGRSKYRPAAVRSSASSPASQRRVRAEEAEKPRMEKTGLGRFGDVGLAGGFGVADADGIWPEMLVHADG
ncbi:hypothetical protein M5K25_009271 [Dendrobium thyrsiflorum]|uniref:Uncharacterized protein n=1 Tax=Dendrobium thyrsiflorum TaxID=117978 RepID=A0ABD0VBX9_DENTH